MPHTYVQSVVHHIPAIENILESWRWDREHPDSDHYDNHLLVLTAENPVSINLHQAPEGFEFRDSFNVVISRGADITLILPKYSRDGIVIGTLPLLKDTPYEIRYSTHSKTFRTRIASDRYPIGSVFNLIKFDLFPILFPHSIPDARPSLTGRLAFQCDWTGAKTLSVWRDGTHKIFKFYNVKSGYHCVDYDIPRTLVAPWTASGKTRIMPLDLRVEDAGVERMVWTGATKLDVPDLSFSQNESDSD